MPLVTEIIRGGEKHVPEGGWTEYALSAMITAALKEHDGDMEFQSGETLADIEDGKTLDFVWTNPIYLLDSSAFKSPLIRRGEQTLIERHEFGEIVFLPGDRLRMWRE